MITCCIARSARRRHLIYSEADFEVFRPMGADFEVFRPTGATCCIDGVKFGTEEETSGPLLHAKFQPIRCNDKVIGPHN